MSEFNELKDYADSKYSTPKSPNDYELASFSDNTLNILKDFFQLTYAG
jgi:hypothetical protein